MKTGRVESEEDRPGGVTSSGQPQRAPAASEVTVANTASDAAQDDLVQATASTPIPHIPGYAIQMPLGEGGMGTVYLATHLVLQRQVALKVLKKELSSDPLFTERFLREARLAASVSHANVIHVSDAGRVHEYLYIALDYVSGGDLGKLMARKGILPEREALRIIGACAQGLGAIHKAGLVHRDIKPENILFDQGDVPKITDLGLARSIAGNDRLTTSGDALGTPAYMSPEQARGIIDIDGRTDIYSLGATFFVLLTGKLPLTGATPYETVHHILSTDAPDVRSLNPNISVQSATIIRRCLEKDRDRRYRSVDDLQADVIAALGGEPLPSLNDLHDPRDSGTVISALWSSERFPGRVLGWFVGSRMRSLGTVIGIALVVYLVLPRATVPGPAAAPTHVSAPVPMVAPAGPSRDERLARARAISEAANPPSALRRSIRGTVVNVALLTVDDFDQRIMAWFKDQGVPVDKHLHDRISGEYAAKLADGTSLHIGLRRLTEDGTEISFQIGAFGDRARADLIFSELTR